MKHHVSDRRRRMETPRLLRALLVDKRGGRCRRSASPTWAMTLPYWSATMAFEGTAIGASGPAVEQAARAAANISAAQDFSKRR